MMSAEAALQGAILQVLRADAAVKALVGERIYDRIPEGAHFPYVDFGETQVVDDSSDCIDGTEMFLDLHVWSQHPSSTEAKEILAAVRRVLRAADLSLGPGHTLAEIEHRTHRVFRDADGLRTHGVITFRAVIESE